MTVLSHNTTDLTINNESANLATPLMIRSDYQILDALLDQAHHTQTIVGMGISTRPANNIGRIREALHTAAVAAGLGIERMDTVWCDVDTQHHYMLNPQLHGIAYTLVTAYIKRTNKEGEAA